MKPSAASWWRDGVCVPPPAAVVLLVEGWSVRSPPGRRGRRTPRLDLEDNTCQPRSHQKRLHPKSTYRRVYTCPVLGAFQNAFRNACWNAFWERFRTRSRTRSGTRAGKRERVKSVRTRLIDGELWRTRLAVYRRLKRGQSSQKNELQTVLFFRE